jgi:hypothetical protein
MSAKPMHSPRIHREFRPRPILVSAFVLVIIAVQNSSTFATGCNSSDAPDSAADASPAALDPTHPTTSAGDVSTTTARVYTPPRQGSQDDDNAGSISGPTTARSTTTRSEEQTNTSRTLGDTYSTSASPCTVTNPNHEGGQNTAPYYSSQAATTASTSYAVATRRLSTTARTLRSATTNSSLTVDTPGGPCSLPTNLSSCPLTCVPVNGVYRCLAVKTEGEACDTDQAQEVCDPRFICDSQSLACRRAAVNESYTFRQCADWTELQARIKWV